MYMSEQQTSKTESNIFATILWTAKFGFESLGCIVFSKVFYIGIMQVSENPSIDFSPTVFNETVWTADICDGIQHIWYFLRSANSILNLLPVLY